MSAVQPGDIVIVRGGDRVMIVGENCLAQVVLLLAASELDAWFVVVNARLSAREIDAIRDNKAVYMIAVGGAAYLVAKAITASRLLAFPELGMEAIYEFEVKDMPVTLAVDSNGESVHREGPKIWSAKIAERIAAHAV